MATRPDIRDLATNVREAFADADRETLLDILTFVVKEYVAEGPPPMLMHQAETIEHLLVRVPEAIESHLIGLREDGQAIPGEKILITTVRLPEPSAA